MRRAPGARPAPAAGPRRRVIALPGCVQASATPITNAALARVLDRLGIDLIEPKGTGCCGAVAYHLNDQAGGLDAMRHNIDAWWPLIDRRCATPSWSVPAAAGPWSRNTATCWPRIRPTPRRPPGSPPWPGTRWSCWPAWTWPALGSPGAGRRVAFHAPCTLQHGQQIKGAVEAVLTRLGFELTQVADAHLCCGSAGTYSLLQPELSSRLRDNKVAALTAGEPEIIATANIGCQMHLTEGAGRPVLHWLELLDPGAGA